MFIWADAQLAHMGSEPQKKLILMGWGPCHTYFFLIDFNELFYFLFIFGCVGTSLLPRAFSSCGERGLLFVAVHWLLIAVASFVADHGL